ncbi:type ISP restriction/modification enzyme [Roseinatronobacter alkalisoli]|uniref:site-specific DNA-methyltransferase (adenine-specific) n=1 Tax=Roseinatronobacter alkalisoli TaxID=3028235 RepID=A0ABT5TEQ8_9RHOB|nr:type ISP restriction/modification enzyme [Roseinatronobacter sp. HJB301]MDD7973190.1 N-6 DNA methylase [Roseinatronobacter sp. HJB301]
MKFDDLISFADQLKAKFQLPGQASPEDQLKPLVADLIKLAGAGYGVVIETRTETHLAEHKVRPDIAIYADGLICGYIELKAPGLGADAPRLTGKHNRAQWEKLKGLPNLIYTDGREWALYRSGTRPEGQPVIRLHDDPSAMGKAAVAKGNEEAVERLLRDFLGWKPLVPHTPTGLASYLAPLSRFLRSEVESALTVEDSAVKLLANEWRQFFFPDSDDAKFADAYAQTVTYAMLLARLSGAAKLDPAEAAKTLDTNNGLLARTLELLGHTDARKQLAVGFEMLQRSLEALDPHDFMKSKPDLWLYFYEDFLAAYDPKLRKDYGVYYTPREVVELQVRLASELLDNRFGKKLGFADDGVVFLDPAVGTGTYPVAAVKHGLEKVRARSGPGAVPARARQMAENLHGFEVLVGPYAVAHLRLTQALEGAMNDAKAAAGEQEEKLAKRLNIYLADTLSSPNKAPPGGLDLTHKALTQEHEAARKVKQGEDILVCLGNPPYDRQTIEEGDQTTQRKGGWVRFGDQIEGGAKQEKQGERAILKDFTEPASKVGAGGHLKNLYNDYVYFWRWALWRLFEQQACGGIVTFITASSYLAGPGFVGVREVMRRTFDEIWIIDLGGDNLGTRKTPNVFNIQTPVAIAIGVRGTKPTPDQPAKVRYAKIEGATREDKLTQLDGIGAFAGIRWRDCPDDWHKPFLPVGKGDFFQWPMLIDLFPYQRSGSKFGRPWPIAETRELIDRRWAKLLGEPCESRAKHFKSNKYRKIEREYRDHETGLALPSIASLKPGAATPKVSPYAFRSFDRHFAIEDIRFNDRMGEVLWRIQSDCQLYLTTMTTEVFGFGQAVMASTAVPDIHHLCGRGGKDVIPLYHDTAGADPNVTTGLLAKLDDTFDTAPSVEDLAAYVYAVLAGQSYTRRFWNELETPGPRVPITKDAAIFYEAVALGGKMIWLHTYSERFRSAERGDEIPPGTAKIIKGVSDDLERYPEEYAYDPATQEITVGDGRFGPVAPEIWAFEVSGLHVVRSWLGYRMKKRAGKKSSPLDEIRPERWTARMSDELLEMLWVLEATLAMEPALEAMLDKVVAGPCFLASDLPTPSDVERKARGGAKQTAEGQLGLFEDDEDEEE